VAANQAIYGVGLYGSAIYGVVPVTVAISGVGSSATADTDINIYADANHAVVSVSAAVSQGSVGVVGVAIHQVSGTQSSVTAGTSSVTADAITSVTGVSADIIVDVTGEGWDVLSRVIVEVTETVVGTGQAGQPSVIADATIIPPSAQSSVTVSADFVITADALHTTTSVFGTVATGGVGDVTAAAAVDTAVGVPATGYVNDSVTFVCHANVAAPSISSTASANADFTIIADSVHTSTSVFGTTATGGVGDVAAASVTDTVVGTTASTSVGTVVTVAESVYILTSVQAAMAAGAVSVAVTRNVISQTNKNLRNIVLIEGDLERIIYIDAPASRIVSVEPDKPNTVYVVAA
jgi:hypothetical protein